MSDERGRLFIKRYGAQDLDDFSYEFKSQDGYKMVSWPQDYHRYAFVYSVNCMPKRKEKFGKVNHFLDLPQSKHSPRDNALAKFRITDGAPKQKSDICLTKLSCKANLPEITDAIWEWLTSDKGNLWGLKRQWGISNPSFKN